MSRLMEDPAMVRYLWMLAVVLPLTGCGGRPETPVSASASDRDAWKSSVPVPDEKRVEALCTALKNERWPLLPVIQELGVAAPHSAVARDTLLDSLLSERGHITWAYVDAIAEALSGLDVSEVPPLIDACRADKSSKDDAYLEKMLPVFAMMGPKAKAAVPLLEEQLEKHQDDAGMKAALLVALANIVDDSDAHARQLCADVAAHTTAGRAALWTMRMVGPGRWADEAFVAGLVTWVDLKDLPTEGPGLEDAYVAADVLRRIGPRARPALAALKHLCDLTKDNDDGAGRVMFLLAVWQIDPEQEDYLRKALGYIGRGEIGCNVGHSEVDFMLRRLNPEEVAALLRRLEDADPDVQRGAVEALASLGLRAQEARPVLLKIVQSDAPKETRKAAAAALKSVRAEADLRPLDDAQPDL